MALRTLPDAVSNAPVYNRRGLLRQYASGKQMGKCKVAEWTCHIAAVLRP
jgi:hypothetical protein